MFYCSFLVPTRIESEVILLLAFGDKVQKCLARCDNVTFYLYSEAKKQGVKPSDAEAKRPKRSAGHEAGGGAELQRMQLIATFIGAT